MKIRIDDIELRPGEDEKSLPDVVKRKYRIGVPFEVTILRRSLDARNRRRIVYRYRLLVDLSDDEGRALLDEDNVSEYCEPAAPAVMKSAAGLHALVVGAGPAGLFCALRLVEAGAGVAILERGRDVVSRLSDIRALERDGTLDVESNVVFGEGGAGAYSDGKLTTRIRRPEVEWFLRRLVDFGAPNEVMYEARPHVGTDRLAGIIMKLRDFIIERGASVHFGERMSDILFQGKRSTGVRASSGREFFAPAVVLATGHSARDVYELLSLRGFSLEKKGFAAGVRVEHPADLINRIQYGKEALTGRLPAADYFLAYNNKRTGMGTYSFCMCPGGEVINSSSERERLCVNGMSYSARSNGFSNAALVVTVRPEKLPEVPLAGIAFQRELERAAYEAGGGGFFAPAQTVQAFLDGKIDEALPAVSYRPGARPARLDRMLPPWMAGELREALRYFNTRMKGFTGAEAVLIGVETRTSSPVRIARGDDFQAQGITGLYPAGEGAGYAGGIVSSAVDGIRIADAIIASHGR